MDIQENIMGTEPFITVGIASYNYARFLPRAFEAIKRQEFKDYEVLYCDDGSTDDSVAVIQSFIRDNPEMDIRLVQGENGGVVANKKRIQQNARGTYVMLCDADDWMADDCLETLAAEARRTGADRIIGEVVLTDKDGNEVRRLDVADPSSKWMHTLWHGCLYRTQVFRDHDFREPRDFLSDDYYFIQTYNLYCKDAAFVRKPVFYNCAHGDNATTVLTLNGRWNPGKNFLQVLEFTWELSGKVEDQDARQVLEYQVIKFYCQALLTVAKAADSYQEFRAYAGGLHDALIKRYPRYAWCPKIRLFAPNYDRSYGKRGVWAMMCLDRVGLLMPALWMGSHRRGER